MECAPIQAPDSSALSQRLARLDALLHEHQWLWQPQPFKQATPDWCQRLPELYSALLALSDDEVRHYSARWDNLLPLLQPHLPALAELMPLCQLPTTIPAALADYPASLSWDIPGRKWQQIESFVASMHPPAYEVVEWCGGKGHLGRLIHQQHQQLVHTLEINPALCAQGEQLAKRSRTRQQFVALDVLEQNPQAHLQHRQVVALHACGELHRRLLTHAVQLQLPQLHLAPCCYHLGCESVYSPMSSQLTLTLTADDVRLAVTETVTAHAREIRLRDQEMAWKLGYIKLLNALRGNQHYQPIRPIKRDWLNLNFEQFCRQLAQRDNITLEPSVDWENYEQLGWQRQRDVMRLNLVRQSFRRAIECWLVFDMGLYLQQHSYQVSIAQFCTSEITPRNILIQAQR